MSPLSNADKLLVAEIVRQTVKTPEMHALFAEAAAVAAEEVVARHQKTCPTAIKVDRAKWLMIGLFAAGGAVGVGGPLAIKLLLAL